MGSSAVNHACIIQLDSEKYKHNVGPAPASTYAGGKAKPPATASQLQSQARGRLRYTQVKRAHFSCRIASADFRGNRGDRYDPFAAAIAKKVVPPS